MQVLVYNDLDPTKITGFTKFKKAIEADNFTQADVRKVADNLYRAKLNQTARLLFSIYRYQNKAYCLVLEYLPNHEYEKSRFLAGHTEINDERIPKVTAASAESCDTVYLNPKQARFHYLDKVISFDDIQQSIFDRPTPLVIVGAAGSGKTALTLEKMKQAVGDVLYISHSVYLVQHSRNLYYSRGYQNPLQEEVDFLSFREYLETIRVPSGREVSRHDFESWFRRQSAKKLPAHKVFEEFRGVLTGPSLENPWLNRDQYLALGVRQSLFSEEQRPAVYVLFEKYLNWLDSSHLYDSNIVSQQYLAKVAPCYDFVVVDEVQDFTNTQLMLILNSLRTRGEFLLCGDANQIVHPNFFSWSKIKTMFFEQEHLQAENQVLHILQANYRNSPLVTAVANRVLKLKHARFGSVDRESNFLVKSTGQHKGQLQLLTDSPRVRQQLDDSTSRSTRFAVVVMYPEQKAEAERIFSTPLVFSIQEAKGLEYNSIILFNFIHRETEIFRHLTQGVELADLEVTELNYARARSKTDKSLETYKFYINSLYVAITRSVSDLYIIETDHQHPLLALLDLSRFSGELNIAKQESSLEEWQQEAHKLELQGKEEQARNIRERILKEKKVPWPVTDNHALSELTDKAIRQGQKKAQRMLFEYSLLHHHQQSLNALERLGYKAVSKAQSNKTQAIKTVYKNHFMLYDLKQPAGVLREIDKYGVNYRSVFNLTPLMTAGFIGNVTLLKVIRERGADTSLVANHGLNAWQMALSRILLEPDPIKEIGAVYELTAPPAVSIQVDGRLEKLDDHTMQGFLINVFFSLWYSYLPETLTKGNSAVTAAALEELLARLPDSVLPAMKKKRAYISRYLSENEVDRDTPRNRKLFKRFRRGHYFLNPRLKVRLGDQWFRLHDLLDLESWDFPLPDYLSNFDPSAAQFIQKNLGKNMDSVRNWLKEQHEEE